MATAALPRVLIVEDDYHISRIIELAMGDLGVPHVLDTALSAEEALELWQQQSYDLLVTDHNLRGMSGLKLVETLHAQGSHPTVIMVSAYDTPQLRRDANAVGIAIYVPKPFIIDELLDVIRRALQPLARTLST